MTAEGDIVRWTHSHPNNLWRVVTVGSSTMIENAGTRYNYSDHEVYSGEASEAHWEAYLARNRWAVR
jgi:hypothetical protein